jgi:MFS family permease
MQSAVPRSRMTGEELRASLSLASLFALRMLGLFLILPVFAVFAPQLTGGDNLALVGLALGIYGLTQAVLQIPYGIAADRFGRKRMIVIGLVLFAAGSFLAAGATSIWMTIVGRAIQGSGAIAAAVMALATDLTREEHRTKVMAMIGASIGLVFALSLVLAPALYRWIGMPGIFDLTGVLALVGIWVTLKVVPPEPAKHVEHAPDLSEATLRRVIGNVELLRLNVGIFALHMVQMAMFVVIPHALIDYGHLPVSSHWQVYLPVVLASFVLMVPLIFVAERGGRARRVFLGAVASLVVVMVGFAAGLERFWAVVALLLAFFVCFNILEASLPSLVSRIAPPAAKATALGVYNTTQAFGLFAGGAVGGWIAEHYSGQAVFVFGAVVVGLWLVAAWNMTVPAPVSTRTVPIGASTDAAELRRQLVLVPGVRDAVVVPEERVAHLKVMPGWDEARVAELVADHN